MGTRERHNILHGQGPGSQSRFSSEKFIYSEEITQGFHHLQSFGGPTYF